MQLIVTRISVNATLFVILWSNVCLLYSKAISTGAAVFYGSNKVSFCTTYLLLKYVASVEFKTFLCYR